jgi:hypothetical protein
MQPGRHERQSGYAGRQPHQRKLGDFFPTVTEQTRLRLLRGESKHAKRGSIAKNKDEEARVDLQTRRPKTTLHPEERTFSCVTQNVNGFGATEAHRDEWMRALKRDDEYGRQDVGFRQETHVEEGDVEFFIGLHARTWVFRVGTGCPPLSFWSPSAAKKGGVAILVDPYGQLKDVKPAMQAH